MRSRPTVSPLGWELVRLVLLIGGMGLMAAAVWVLSVAATVPSGVGQILSGAGGVALLAAGLLAFFYGHPQTED